MELRVFKVNLDVDGGDEDGDLKSYLDPYGTPVPVYNDEEYIYVAGKNISVISNVVGAEYIKSVESLGEVILCQE